MIAPALLALALASPAPSPAPTAAVAEAVRAALAVPGARAEVLEVEGSNVKAVEEMIDMIAVQRAYELNSKVISTADQMLQRLTQMR